MPFNTFLFSGFRAGHRIYCRHFSLEMLRSRNQGAANRLLVSKSMRLLVTSREQAAAVAAALAMPTTAAASSNHLAL